MIETDLFGTKPVERMPALRSYLEGSSIGVHDRDRCMSVVFADLSHFPPKFPQWLEANFGIWRAFAGKAFTIRRRRERYSARTIVETMRWESDLREDAKTSPFKIQNDAVPGMARLFNALTSSEFFSLREHA